MTKKISDYGNLQLMVVGYDLKKRKVRGNTELLFNKTSSGVAKQSWAPVWTYDKPYAKLDPCRRIDTKTELTASEFDSTLC